MCDPLICLANPDVCNPMPGWEVTWNPPACPSSAEASGIRAVLVAPRSFSCSRLTHYLTVISASVQVALPAYGPELPKARKIVCASPGHLAISCNAMLCGVLVSTNSCRLPQYRTQMHAQARTCTHLHARARTCTCPCACTNTHACAHRNSKCNGIVHVRSKQVVA